MPLKILVGINGQQGGLDALALARRLAPTDAELIAVTVVVMETLPSRASSPDYDRALRETGMELLAELRSQHEDVRGELVEAESVAHGLHRAGADFEADLLVLGSCRRGPIGRIFAGDDVRATLRGAPCPVAVAPREYALRDQPIATIGLGWDDSPEAVEALRFARVLADGTSGELHALSVTPAPLWPAAGEAQSDEQAERSAARLERLEGAPVTAVVGDAREALATFAAEVDVLVVGSSQRGLLGRIEMGSVSEALARRSTRPLVVVPRAKADADAATEPASDTASVRA